MRIKSSLVSKLEGVNIGDIVLLKGKRGNAVGYVQYYNVDRVILGTELPFTQLDEDKQRMANFFGKKAPTSVFGNLNKKYDLKYFDSYKILKSIK